MLRSRVTRVGVGAEVVEQTPHKRSGWRTKQVFGVHDNHEGELRTADTDRDQPCPATRGAAGQILQIRATATFEEGCPFRRLTGHLRP
jgi:hypothetical protein